MTKKELIAQVSGKTQTSAEKVSEVVNATLEVIAKELHRGGEVQFIGFGTFGTTVKNERAYRNLHTGEPVVVPAHKSPTFKAGKHLKEVVNR